jgi:hypothetical protein
MQNDERPTDKQLRVPIVLVVAGTRSLTAVVEEASVAAQVLVTQCALADVTSVAAEIRPLVIVVSEEVFLFDQDSFVALAQDIHARLLTVRAEDRHVDRLEAMLKEAIADADELEPVWPSERGER